MMRVRRMLRRDGCGGRIGRSLVGGLGGVLGIVRRMLLIEEERKNLVDVDWSRIWEH